MLPLILGLFSLVFLLRWEESIVVFVTFHRKRWSYRKCTYMRDSMYDSDASIPLPPLWPEFGYWIQCHFWVCWFTTLLLLYDFFHFKKNLAFVSVAHRLYLLFDSQSFVEKNVISQWSLDRPHLAIDHHWIFLKCLEYDNAPPKCDQSESV